MASPNSTPSREGHSQEGSNCQAGDNLVSPQAGRHPLPQDDTASQEASAILPNGTSPGEGSANSTLSQEGNYPPSSILGNTRSQAGNSSASSQAVRYSTRLRDSQASQADNITPQVDSVVSLVNGASPQAVRYSTRLRASQANSTIPQEDSKVYQASRASPPLIVPLPRQLAMLVPRKQGLLPH